MKTKFTSLYKRAVLDYPATTIIAVVLFAGFFALFIKDFKLDASADSLVLENDKDLSYYRSIRERYGSDDYLVVTYSPHLPLFSEHSLSDIKILRQSLKEIPRVESLLSIFDVPLINSPKISFSDFQKNPPMLESPRTDLKLAEIEFRESPLYKDLLVSRDGKTTALLVIFHQDKTYLSLLKKRNALREKKLRQTLSQEESQTLKTVSKQFKQISSTQEDQQRDDIATVRAILDRHRDNAEIHLGGIPMITADMIEYVSHDIEVFGLGVLCFLLILLRIAFKRPRWVILPLLICFTAGVVMVGYLGLVQWWVTVVSSNFISLLLIITLSLTIHLIVRYRELHEQKPHAEQRELVWETIRSKAQPSFYTTLTTMVAFASLLVSGIRPVIDFGWMMVFGIGISFILTFLMFPAMLMFIKPGQPNVYKDITGTVTRYFATFINAHPNKTLSSYLVLLVLSVIGISSLTVENRFIDYFKQSTEIYQGMLKIDRDLGGTTPLDVILDADKEFLDDLKESDKPLPENETDYQPEGSAGISGTSYWFDVLQLEEVEQIHAYLEQLPETGQVLSLATTVKLLKQLSDDNSLNNFILAVMYKRMPADVKHLLFEPYMSADGNQLRFSIRIIESNITLQRQALLDKIREDISNKFDIDKSQIKLSGMAVLYNNMLQSLFRSQIMTLGVVFFAILLMFIVLFRSIKIAAVAIIPNLMSAGLVLGLMGWLRIPLDIMTITIAAITIGIAVDDTIHYVHRFMEEYPKDHNYWATVNRCHSSIGKAMYYTSVTITLGFSILALSNFIPTIYFGLLTGLAMTVALLANLTLLPLILVKFKPIK